MKRLLFSQFANKLERGADVFKGKVVFLLDLLETHPPCKAANDQCNRHAGAANHGFAVANGRVNNDASVSVHAETNSTSRAGFQGHFANSHLPLAPPG